MKNKGLIFFLIGATGDLSRKKILPALYSMFVEKLLPENFMLVGNARREFEVGEFILNVKEWIKPTDEVVWKRFAKKIRYVSGDVGEKKTFDQLKREKERAGEGNVMWYVATLPSLYVKTVRGIVEAGFAINNLGWTKLLLEKPFGTDLSTAQELNRVILAHFDDNQVYRIDHFLAKETVQNILAFRFGNDIFEHLWSGEFIDHIQVSAMEELGVGGRGAFYDNVGTVRDVVQNHVLQMIAMVMMEAPASLEAADIRAERVKLLADLVVYEKQEIGEKVCFGQYTEGKIKGLKVVGYREEEGIDAQSKTETAVAMKLEIKNARWAGVPIYVRAGKRLARQETEIAVVFKPASNVMFRGKGLVERANVLVFKISPNEGIGMRFYVKEPGLTLHLKEVPMTWEYKQTWQIELVEAYVKLIHDAIKGDTTLFPHAQSLEYAWRLIDPILSFHHDPRYRVEEYKAGTEGPDGFSELLARDGREWIKG